MSATQEYQMFPAGDDTKAPEREVYCRGIIRDAIAPLSNARRSDVWDAIRELLILERQQHEQALVDDGWKAP